MLDLKSRAMRVDISRITYDIVSVKILSVSVLNPSIWRRKFVSDTENSLWNITLQQKISWASSFTISSKAKADFGVIFWIRWLYLEWRTKSILLPLVSLGFHSLYMFFFKHCRLRNWSCRNQCYRRVCCSRVLSARVKYVSPSGLDWQSSTSYESLLGLVQRKPRRLQSASFARITFLVLLVIMSV